MGYGFAAVLLWLQQAPVSAATQTALVIAAFAVVGVSALVQLLLWRTLRNGDTERSERYRAELRRREESAGIAQLLTYAGRPGSVDSQTLNQLAWEIYLWLPAPLAAELTAVLQRGESDPRDILIRVRRHLHGDRDPLTRDQIPRW